MPFGDSIEKTEKKMKKNRNEFCMTVLTVEYLAVDLRSQKIIHENQAHEKCAIAHSIHRCGQCEIADSVRK